METPTYIKSLLKANIQKPQGRKVWSIDLETAWLPFFTATNTMGETRIPVDAIGAPLRLAYNPDGAVRFSKSGRPVVRVAKDIADSVRLVRENFVSGLQAYTHGVITDNSEGYTAQAQASREAGAPIIANDKAKLNEAVNKAIAEAIAHSEAEEAKANAKAEAVAEAEAITKAEVVAEAPAPKAEAPAPKRKPKVRELVTA